MRTARRPRRYVARHWLLLMRPFLRYSGSRDAYVLRGVGRQFGPVLRGERRVMRGPRPFDGVERRGVRVA
jgi:hypothetical protein